MTTKPPDPSGPAPEGFNENQWASYCLLAAGTPIRATADQVGLSRGTVGRYIKKWRETWPDLFKQQAAANSKANAESRAENLNQGGQEPRNQLKKEWDEMARSGSALEFSNVGQLGVAVMGRFLTHLLTDQDGAAVKAMSARDIRDIGKITTDAFAMADRLGGHAHPDKTTPRRGPGKNVGAVVNVDLSGLNKKAQGSNVIEMRDHLEKLSESFKRRRALDVAEAEAESGAQ